MDYLQYLGALALSILLGSIIGLEREANNHPAGFRTHALVCVGSALLSIVSWSIYESFNQTGDPGRIAAQVVSGIGFLGAGTIMREGANIKGLTTAASLWTVAAIGIAVGFKYYFIAITTTVFVVMVLQFFSILEKKFIFTKQLLNITIIVEDKPGMLGEIGRKLGNLNVSIRNVYMESKNGKMHVNLHLKIPPKLSVDNIMRELMDSDGILGIDYQD
ncbi:MgtC/SapB family protein [Alkalicella caledoniensis]|uniref:MgtC/SapB family protein n=1 Tax=Alkalicella caledoniensis TaxID=2731377 RepID=A0A7G9WCP7_ALKCA|nr:MgtC/SapB family protein [Alkalicella caledoniensis]QNO16459.1 MgtC/SapB family protein [Alkalicella caledoniensis]